DRLAEVRGDGAGSGQLERLVERVERSLPGGIEAPRARRDVEGLRQVWTERTVHARTAGERERLERRPVVRLRRRDHLPALGLGPLDVVASGELVGLLVRRRGAGG